MKPSEAAKIVAFLANAPDSRSSAAWTLETQELFAQMIEDLDYEPSKAAVFTWLKTKQSRPSIPDFRGAVRQQLESAGAIPADPDADQAWGIVTKAFSAVGRYREFPATHPAVKRVVDRIGWETLCSSSNPEADRAHFLRMYGAEIGRERDARHSAPALARPGDAERLSATAAPTVNGTARAALPAPDRARGLEQIRHIRTLLSHGQPEATPRREVDHSSCSTEPVELCQPTAEEERAAADRRARLRAQLAEIERTGEQDRAAG